MTTETSCILSLIYLRIKTSRRDLGLSICYSENVRLCTRLLYRAEQLLRLNVQDNWQHRVQQTAELR